MTAKTKRKQPTRPKERTDDRMTARIPIGLDPGFHSLKVTSPFGFHKHPFVAMEVKPDLKEQEYIFEDSLLILHDKTTNKYWVIGEYARKKTFNTAVDEKIFYTDIRFQEENNKIIMLAGIALGMLKKEGNTYVKQEGQPYVNVALPHSMDEKWSEVVMKQLMGVHAFRFQIGKKGFIDFTFEIGEDDITTTSQSVCAMLSMVLDNSGEAKPNAIFSNNNINLFLDGGFYTLGILYMDGMQIDDQRSDSNTQLSMINAYKTACQEITRLTNRETHFWEIDNHYEKNKFGYGKNQTIEVRPIVDKAVQDYAEKTVQYLDKIFDYCNDVDYIVVAGGTGYRYFDALKNHYGEKVVLAGKESGEEEFESVFAISVGAYRLAIAQLKHSEAAVEEAE